MEKSPLKAIRAKCLDCCLGEMDTIRNHEWYNSLLHKPSHCNIPSNVDGLP